MQLIGARRFYRQIFTLPILRAALTLQSFTSKDLDPLFKGSSTRQKAYQINKLKEAGFIKAVPNSPRTYFINFTNSKLMRGLIQQLRAKGIIEFEI